MTATSKKQQQFMGAELARKRAGKATTTDMTEQQLQDFAGTPTKGLPARAKSATKGKAGKGKDFNPFTK